MADGTDLVSAAAARALLEGATPGPWFVVHTDDDSFMNAVYVGTVNRGTHHDRQVGLTLDRMGEIIAPTLAQTPCMVGTDTSRWDEDAALIAHAPNLARTVIALHERLEGVGVAEYLAARNAATMQRGRADRAERERDEARAERDRAEHDLLRRLWQRIDGDQDGCAPSATAMEDGLVRLFDEMRADVERCAADENASTQEAERLATERARLARILAVERGDEGAALDGWTRMEHVSGWRARDRHGRGWTVRYDRLGDGWHTASVYLDGIRVYSGCPTALEAMEAADKIREP